MIKTEDIKPRSSSKQRPIFKAENKFETLEYMETDDELDTESTNLNKKTPRKLQKKKPNSETVSTKSQNPSTSKNHNTNEHPHQTN